MDRTKPLPQSDRPEAPSQNNLEGWYRVVKDPLFQQVLTAYRASLAERHLAVACSNKDNKEAQMTEIQAEHSFIAKILTGGLDEVAMDVLGIATPDSVPKIVDYMKRDEEMNDA